MVGGQSNYAYAFEWHGYYAPRAANRLLSKGVRIKVATSKFEGADEREFDRGTILIPVTNQKISAYDLFEELQAIAREDGLDIHALNSGLTGGVSLGSNSFVTLQKPEVALVVEAGSSYDIGEVWHLLDTRMNMLATKLPQSRLGSTAIDRYNTIIISGGLNLSESAMENLKRWIRNGGTLVGTSSAVRWMARNKLTNLKSVSAKRPSAEEISYDQISNYARGQNIPGGVYMSTLDLSHPMTFGYYRELLPTFRRGNTMIEPSESKFANPGRYTEEPLRSGWISDANLEALKGTSTIRVNALGNGRIVSLVDNPNFRAFWYGTNKLMMNAIFFGRIVNRAAAQ